MKTGNTSAHEFASRTSARGYTTFGCVATVTTLAFALNAGVLAQGTTSKTTQQTEGQRQLTLGRLTVPITGTVETTATTPLETLTTPTETPTIPADSTTTTPVTEVTAIDASTPDVTGSFSIRRFARTTDDGVAAVGMLTLSITDPTSNAARTIVTELTMPVSRSGAPATSGAADAQTQPLRPTSFASPSAAAQPCEALSLVLGALRLDVLGNPIQLNETNLDIIAGERFGKALCDVGDLMNGAGRAAEIVRKLNTLLETIG